MFKKKCDETFIILFWNVNQAHEFNNYVLNDTEIVAVNCVIKIIVLVGMLPWGVAWNKLVNSIWDMQKSSIKHNLSKKNSSFWGVLTIGEFKHYLNLTKVQIQCRSEMRQFKIWTFRGPFFLLVRTIWNPYNFSLAHFI